MIPTPLLIADLLDGNGLDNLGEGELVIPESMLNTLLSSIELPLPIAGVDLKCQSGYFAVVVKLDLRGQGLPLKPEVEQMFELDRVRLDPINQFILIKPRGGLRVREETVSTSRLSPMATAVLTTMLHTPTLLKLVRDRFPKRVNYDNGRVHINLAGTAAMEGIAGREIDLGHVKLHLLDFLTIRDVDIRKRQVVIRFRFEKEQLLAKLREPPPEGFYAPPCRPEPPESRLLTAGGPAGPDESKAQKALRVSRSVGKTVSKAGVLMLKGVLSRRK